MGGSAFPYDWQALRRTWKHDTNGLCDPQRHGRVTPVPYRPLPTSCPQEMWSGLFLYGGQWGQTGLILASYRCCKDGKNTLLTTKKVYMDEGRARCQNYWGFRRLGFGSQKEDEGTPVLLAMLHNFSGWKSCFRWVIWTWGYFLLCKSAVRTSDP